MCTPTIQSAEWHNLQVEALTPAHTITLLGRELRVLYSQPSERGGDFYVLEAFGRRVDNDTEHYQDVVSFTLDKHQMIYARES